MPNNNGKQQAVSGNINATYTTEQTSQDQTPQVTEDGKTITADRVFGSGRTESESITTTETALNSGNTLKVPNGAGVLVKNSLNSSNNMKLSLPNGSGSVTYAPGGGDIWFVDDVSKISVQGVGGSVTVEYALEEKQ